MRHFLTDPPPDDAEVHGRLKFLRIDNGMICAKAWRGKAQKPYAYIRFRNTDDREQWIADQISSDEAEVRFKQERKAQEREAVAKMRGQLQIGTILHYS